MVLSLAACAGNDNASDAKDDDEEEETQELDKNTDEEEDDKEDPQPNVNANFEPQVILDNDDLLLTITGFEYDHDSYFSMLLQIENRSSVELVVEITDILVNGNEYDSPWINDYEPGEIEEEGNLRFYYEDCLTAYGEEIATCITFTVEVYDSETYDTLYTTDVTVYPYGEDAA